MLTKNLTRAGIVATIAATLIVLPMAANATEETVWQAWIMPNDGTDWPQQVASDGNLAGLPCGTTWRIQNDEYLPHERDRFAADGVLEYGEDFGSEYQRGAISWYFTEHTTAPCAPTEVTPVTPTVTPGTGTCLDGVWTETPSVLSFTDAPNVRYSIDGITYSPNPGPIKMPGSELTVSAQTAEGPFTITQPEGWTRFDAGTVQYTATSIALTPEDCTITTPTPTDTSAPQPTPTAVPQAVEADAAPAPSSRTASATTLAETGPEDTGLQILIGGGILAIAAGALILGRRKQEKR